MQDKELELILNRDLLFDFYGDLLTDHQKRIFEEVVFNDCSVSEVARDEGISRQGISDLIRRTEDQLKSYEAKLGLVRKFRRQRRFVREIRQLAEKFETDGDMAHIGRIRSAAEQLLREE
ncbi:MAG: YlxM family DNA-binding protein [Stomatobaculum sp.]